MAKKITATITLSLIGVLIIATIIMANIKIDYSVNCANPNMVYVNDVQVTDTQKDQIIKFIDKASKTNSLTALFNGTMNNKAEVKAENTAKSVPTSADYRVEFVYNTPQNLMEGNKKYQDKNNKTYTYERLVFAINNLAGEADFRVYIVDSSAEPNTYTRYYVLSANFEDLYNYLKVNC